MEKNDRSPNIRIIEQLMPNDNPPSVIIDDINKIIATTERCISAELSDLL